MRRPSFDLTEPSRNLEESIGPPTPRSPDPAVDLSTPPAEHEIRAEEPQDDDRILSPPPHIAARFYRPTQNRRKDSAASSRRNSISSAHSRSSHGCSRQGGPQSKYVAQHLRRASILEDRKARLADRAAHAEKVRLRAALAKAATKDTSVSEERALAAQQTRERNLAEIAAACAEEVKRAKAVAETMKEKREQELRKMRLQMEERQAEAERRREELQKRNASRARARGQSIVNRKSVEVLPQVREVTEGAEAKERETRPMSDEVAAGKLQWWWRSALRRRAVAEFAQLGLTVDGVRGTSFEKVTELLAQERVLIATARILRICGLREGEVGSVEEMAAVRTFLSAFLILGHPAQVLSNKEGKGEQEQDLVGKARDLLISFENILPRLTTMNNYHPPPVAGDTLPEVYATFYNAFIAWKARDSSALIEVMLMQFVELDAIWQAVKDSTDGSVDEVYRQSIKENQLMLIVRIKKLAGQQQGKKMIFEAVRQARKAREKKPTGDTKPRVADNVSSEAVMGHLGTATAGRIPTPPPTPSARTRAEVKVTVGDGTGAGGIAVGGGISGLLPDNRIVVHELAINREYRLSPDEYKEYQHHLLVPLFDEMRSTMQADNQDAHFALLLEVAKYIREKLQRLVKPGNSMHTFIGEMLDTDMAQRQFVTGSFSYEKFFAAMGSLLPKLCAPFRDDEVKDLVENKLGGGNYVDRLEALMEFIDVMISDYANYLLRLAAPSLVESASTYEAKIFTAGLETGKHGLTASEIAWRAARAKVLTEAARRDPEGINHPRSRPTPDRFYNQMLVDVFTQLSPIPYDEMPEMLQLDHKRAVRSGQSTRRIIIAGAILLQCKNMLKRDVRAPWKTEAGRIMTVLEAADNKPGQVAPDTAVEGIMAALEAGRSMPAATKAHLRTFVTKIVRAGAEAATRREAEPGEPVLRLLLSRLRGHVLARLGAASASEKVRATSTAGEKLAGLGLAEFVERVRDMVDEIARVGAVDRDAHGVWWEKVADTVEKEAEAEAEAEARKTGTAGESSSA